MHKLLSLLCLTISLQAFSQQTFRYERGKSSDKIVQNQQTLFSPELAPFYHGVASGDPLSNAVIIWTRITQEEEKEYEVYWRISKDRFFTQVVQEGTTTTNAAVDYTVKIDVTGLEPETTYYYHFHDPLTQKNSLIGRTRTAPEGALDVNHLRFAITSCSNYQAGYFVPYRKIAERKDLDAVIHLGDYIYEYGGGDGTYGYDESRADRIHEPATEILEIVDYRARYSLYRLDPDLRTAHQQNPFIAIWDDHESANDSYIDGAENHNDGEGAWEDRKAISKQVYFEWMPIRNHPDNKITRTLNYGDLATIINLDTRLEGREAQINDVTNPLVYAEDRTMLGADQKQWLLDELSNSTAQWNLINNQVMFSEFNVGWAGPALDAPPEALESVFLDIWDGYPAERDMIIDHIKDNEIDNVVFLTGDVHTTFCYDVAKRPTDNHPDDLPVDYDPETGDGSIAVEFIVPSVTSANFNENLPQAVSTFLAGSMNQPTQFNGFSNPNPHMKYTNLDDHGYFVLDVTEGRAQADYFFSDIFNLDTTSESFGEGWFTNTTANRLSRATGPAPEKETQPELAPAEAPDFGTLSSENVDATIEVFNVYPNPVTKGETFYVQYGKLNNDSLTISLHSSTGKLIGKLFSGDVSKGIYFSELKLPDTIASGTYVLVFKDGKNTITRKLIAK